MFFQAASQKSRSESVKGAGVWGNVGKHGVRKTKEQKENTFSSTAPLQFQIMQVRKSRIRLEALTSHNGNICQTSFFQTYDCVGYESMYKSSVTSKKQVAKEQKQGTANQGRQFSCNFVSLSLSFSYSFFFSGQSEEQQSSNISTGVSQ